MNFQEEDGTGMMNDNGNDARDAMDGSESSSPEDWRDPLLPILGTPKEILARYSHCPQCRAYLHLTHITDFIRNLTEETARCPECGVQARKNLHRLQ
jgi:hypothetical protein